MKWWIEDMPSGYARICQDVVEYGQEVAPRGQKTREVLNPLIVVGDPTRGLPVGTNRKLNPAIGAVEAAQLIAGVSDPELTVRVAPNMKQFVEEEGTFHGAYGPRVGYQMQRVIERLQIDPDTRQAVVMIWDSALDLEPAKDLPCTLTFVFMIRDDKLILTTTMRSNDVWWGLPYDIFQFTQLQLTVARCLGIETGEYHHRPISLHAYERDFDGIAKLEYNDTHYDVEPLTGFGNDSRTLVGCGKWDVFAQSAKWTLTGGLDEYLSISPTERWYRDKLAPYVG